MADADSDPITSAGEMRIQSENIAFGQSEMVACGKCSRLNPPIRALCMYCSTELAVDLGRADLVAPKLRKLEAWEPAFNVIIRPAAVATGADLTAIAGIVGLEPEKLAEIAATGYPLPIARAGSQPEADIIIEALKPLGIDAFAVSDEKLMPDRSPVRLRGIRFGDSSLNLIDFGSGGVTGLALDDIAVIVAGTISESRIDQTEKLRRGKEVKVLDQVETGKAEAVLDIYDRGNPSGFRVMLAGFDFSCLGIEKTFLAVENMKRLTQMLIALAPNARFIDNYRDVRKPLSSVWEIDERKDPKGMQRAGFAKFEFGKTFSRSNLRQMNKYSRLQWHLL